MKRKLLLTLTVIGILISSYLFYSKLTNTPLYCGSSQGCGAVQNSKHSTLLNVPLGFWGMLYYFVLFAFIYTQETPRTKVLKKLTIIWGLFFSLYLTALEEFVIGAYCLWCVASFVNIILIAVLSLVPQHKPNAV